ncbi:hypothetical protein DICVIV_06031 [Dictyocaulus viviparus]|uniref:Nucleolus and neural progenitor protein-like N-terminal domain-containing protein n=1 Tax=Dictyocaulus viviparus TaxID=29172 RepID=A0A0D8XTG2_DICVI|nr:hypothetical protein DICVIV_06031 [Dictyocaulus viviparus]
MDQLKTPLVPNTQALGKALVYKFNGPHRRQGFWRNYKHLMRSLRKYNGSELLHRVSDLHKKATASEAGFHMLTVDAFKYVGGAYLKRLFILQQIQDLCLRTAHSIMGQIELGHWEKFSLFIIAMCADINSGVGTQARSMESVYDEFSKFLKQYDNRYPDSLTQFAFFPTLCGRATVKKTLDTALVMRILQLSDEQLDEKRQMDKFRDEILSSMKKEEIIDLGEAVDREMDDDIEHCLSAFEDNKDSSTSYGFQSANEMSSSRLSMNDSRDKQQKGRYFDTSLMLDTGKNKVFPEYSSIDSNRNSQREIPASSARSSEITVRRKKKKMKRRMRNVSHYITENLYDANVHMKVS